MSRVPINYNGNSLCLCEICKCGDHKCIPKTAEQSKETRLLSKDAHESKLCCVNKNCGNHVCDQPPEINLYSKSIYKEDFSIKPNIAGPSETAKLLGTLKCEDGITQTKSAYARDYVPYAVEEVKLFQLKHEEEDLIEKRQVKTEQFDMEHLKPEVVQRLRNYYCPTHCSGKVNKSKINYLSFYNDKFNLGPPSRKAIPPMRKSLEPFSKFTNYSLDYIQHKIKAREKVLPHEPQTNTLIDSAHPRSFGTTHKSDYICWSPDDYTEKGRRLTDYHSIRPSMTTFNFGVGGPMDLHSSSAVDYRKHKVDSRSRSLKTQDEFIAPNCRMETETTSSLAFRKWEAVSVPVKVKPTKETNHITSSNDTTCFVTNYQQDFDDLKNVFCPAKLIEKYGRKILEPKYHYAGSENKHDYYRKKNLT